MSPTVAQVLDLAHAATAVDGVAPFSEQPLLALRRSADPPESVLRTVVRDGAIVAAALASEEDPTSIEAVVHPDHRGRGIGVQLVGSTLAAQADSRFWAHGKLPAAQALADRLGLVVVRELWRMERSVGGGLDTGSPSGSPYSTSGAGSTSGALPEGFAARAFVPGQDEDAWLAVNAAAFAGHPEQGRMTRADLDARMAQDWFDPAGLILVEDTATGALAASHWTKIAPDGDGVGEVYVVAVAPAYQGRGLGRPLTALGLAHLAARDVRTVQLYVEADNAPAVATYRRHGFEVAAVDAMYAKR